MHMYMWFRNILWAEVDFYLPSLCSSVIWYSFNDVLLLALTFPLLPHEFDMKKGLKYNINMWTRILECVCKN